MVPKYRGTLPAAGDLQEIDRALVDKTKKLPSDLAAAYERLELHQCALLPVELARATNGYIEATAPFKLEKDPAQAARLDTVLNVIAQAVYASLVALLPVLPDKAAAGLAQMGIDVAGKTLPHLFATPLPAGAQFGAGTPLFPRLEAK
jgi:methionyl-tRNA synthetase